jgi:acetyltransferase
VELLGAFGFQCAAQLTSNSQGEAKEAAAKLGYPVILKVLVPGVAHRSDAGLVSGKITGGAELEQVYAALAAQRAEARSGREHRQRRKVCRA